MTKRLRGKCGEAVMLVIMGAMLVGGIVVWLSTGHFHIMGTHGSHHGSAESHADERQLENNAQENKENKDFRADTIISE